MANTGRICLMLQGHSPRGKRERVLAALTKFVENDVSLKNLDVRLPDEGWAGPSIIVADIDRLTPKDVEEFVRSLPDPSWVAKAFSVNSIYGDDWEEVHW